MSLSLVTLRKKWKNCVVRATNRVNTCGRSQELHQVLTQIGSGVFSPEDPGRYRDLVDSLINFGDHYQVLADYRSYVDCQDKVDELYELQEEWTAKAMLNIANMGYFSSDRTIKEYADHIWHIDPVRL
ncbi:glycogen/starch/alpha-glucan phosphorylase [Escherichia coli]